MSPRLSSAVRGTSRITSLCLPVSTRQCFYHSGQQSQPPPFPPAESAILSAALSHVPSHGFSAASLKLGARDAGYLDVSTNLLPRGVYDLVQYHLVTQRLALREAVQFPATGAQRKTPGVGTKVRTLALARLRANGPLIQHWQEALAIMAQPTYVAPSVAELARLSDEIWYLAGDTSVDASWYSKRATLSAVYSASEVFMTQDTSDNFVETEQFLDSRLADVMKIGGMLGSLGEWAGYTAHSAINVLRSKGVRI